ncbi:MAG: insulinase family protein [Burkholderiaceae bacterium]|nr:insulinase family protein [Burkholderiaceae bacterium]
MQPIRSTLVALLATICSVTSAQTAVSSTPTESARPLRALPAGVTRGPTVEGITEYRLVNGLRVVLFADPSKPTATVNITYLVGSRHENYGETGMAHLLEHLIFKGSKNFLRPDAEFTRRGFQNNGTTWLDRTNYYSTFQASDDNLKWAIDWSADAMVNSFIAKKDLDSEMTVVRNEFESGENNPSRVMLKRMQSMLYDWHNYGNSTIGARSDIENVRIDNLQAFYRTYYQPDNAVLIVAGKFDEGKTLGWIAQAFGKIPKPKRSLPVAWTIEPTHDGERSFSVRRPGEVQLLMVGYRVPSSLSPQSLATGIAADILGDTPNGRLHQALVATGQAAQIFNFNIDSREPGFIVFGAVVKKGEALEPVRQAMIDVIESWGKTPATDAELKRQVQQARTSYDRTLADPQAFGVGLSEYISLGDWRLFFLQRDQLAKLTAAEVDQAAQKYFVRDNRVVGSYIPEDVPLRAEIPAAPSAAQLLADYKPSEKGTSGEAFITTQENIDKRTRVLKFGNLNVALLPKQNRGNTVNVQTQFQWGSPESLSGRMIEADLAAAMLGRGTDKMTRQQIADEMTRLQITGGLTGFQTTRENLPDALRLLAHAMRAASFPASEYEQLQRQVATGLQAQLDNPEAISRDALATHFNTYPAGDPRHYIPLRARIDAFAKTPLDATRRFHNDFYGTARGEVAVVGDFDAKQIETLVNELFTDYPSKAPYARLEREYREVKPARLTVDTPEKENAYIRARIDFPLRDADPDAPALVLANDIFGGGAGLSNRVIERLRQRDGISYGAGTGLTLGSRYPVSSWTAAALMAPQNVAKAEQALREEIERARRDGFTAKELDDAKKGTLQERATNRSRDNVLAGNWAANMDLGRTFAFSKQFEDRLQAVTLDQVNAAFRKYIDPARITFVIAGDAKKGAK